MQTKKKTMVQLAKNWDCRKYVIWILSVVVVGVYVVESCIEEERLALLHLNSYLRSQMNPKYVQFFVGLDDGAPQNYNCCTWKRVRCNPIDQRVVELNLDNMHGPIEYTNKSYIFNVTMLQPFQELRSLDLSSNQISGLADKNGSTPLSTLKNLQSFSLGGNMENGQIFLGALTSLKSLTLDMWGLNESTLHEVENLKKLQVLNLNYNDFGIPIFQKLCQLKNLLELHLQSNHLSGVMPSCLHNLSSLQVLDLSYNALNGWFQLQDIPLNLASLKYLDISYNYMKGPLLPNIFPSLTSLEYLDLSYNYFEANFSLSSLANLSNLYHLDLSRSHLQVDIEDSLWQPSFQLQTLALEGCSLNESGANVIIRFLSQQHNLSYIDLSDNNLDTDLASWLLQNNSPTFPIYFRHSLNNLIISGNNFHGHLDKNIGFLYPQLQYLNASRCSFEGSIPASLAQITELDTLDLSFNNLSGELPRELLMNSTYLSVLQLNDNKLRGDVIPDYMYLPFLFTLKLSNNNFGGIIIESLRNSSNLAFLDISNNNVTGSLPNWIADFPLNTLSISKNILHGEIPMEICKLKDLVYLDLSHIYFTGSIPACSTLSSLSFMFLQNNNFIGAIPSALSSSLELTTLVLSDNQLSGGIPLWIGQLLSLQILLLAGNNFLGQIPPELCDLKDISLLDLSRNHLFGMLPPCFANLSFGSNTISANYIPNMSFDDHRESVDEVVQLLVKNGYYSYKGKVLGAMAVLDLSSNKLSGAIPLEWGNLQHIHSVNLSHNSLVGPIPITFSNLKEVESLDLSRNNLSGEIPVQLAELNNLEVFNASFNNLTGKTPNQGQFQTFVENSYFGNPGLCVSLLNNSCNTLSVDVEPFPANNATEEYGDKSFGIEDFLWSFGVTSFIAFLATIIVLGINPQWLEALFHFAMWHFLWWLPY